MRPGLKKNPFGLKRPRVREASTARHFRTWCAARGLEPIKLSTTPIKGRAFGNAGWPDYLVLGSGGRCAFVELKGEGGRVTELQNLRIATLRTRGFTTVVWQAKHRSLESVADVLARALGVEP